MCASRFSRTVVSWHLRPRAELQQNFRPGTVPSRQTAPGARAPSRGAARGRRLCRGREDNSQPPPLKPNSIKSRGCTAGDREENPMRLQGSEELRRVPEHGASACSGRGEERNRDPTRPQPSTKALSAHFSSSAGGHTSKAKPQPLPCPSAKGSSFPSCWKPPHVPPNLLGGEQRGRRQCWGG